MTYFSDLNTYLHQSSLLIQAYPQTTRITTKYSLPQKPKPNKSKPTETNSSTDAQAAAARPKREPSATLTLKTFHPDSGICLKYQTDKAAEVSRLMTGLGRLAKGEIIENPTGDSADATVGSGIAIGAGEALSNGGPSQVDKMNIDSPPPAEAKTASQMTQGQQNQAGGGGKKKKKSKK